MVSGQWSVVSGQWSVISGQWSVVSGQWSVVSGRPGDGCYNDRLILILTDLLNIEIPSVFMFNL